MRFVGLSSYLKVMVGKLGRVGRLGELLGAASSHLLHFVALFPNKFLDLSPNDLLLAILHTLELHGEACIISEIRRMKKPPQT